MQVDADNESKVLEKVINMSGFRFTYGGELITAEELVSTDGFMAMFRMTADSISRESGLKDGLGYTFGRDENSLFGYSSDTNAGVQPFSVRSLYLLDALVMSTNPTMNADKTCSVEEMQLHAAPYIDRFINDLKQERKQ